MISASELRKNNKVSYYKPMIDKPVIDTIIGVLPVEEYGGVECAYLKNYSPINIDALIPIPLTPEILEKCGFNVAYSFIKCVFDNIGFKVILCGREQILHIQYLHQLQNLYFALTMEELKINLNVETYG